jgi:hypothetical protein
MSRWLLRAGALLVVGGFLFAWVPDVDLGLDWGGGRAESAPEAGSSAEGGAEPRCGQQDIDTTPDPSTDITAFRAERSGNGLVLAADFHDLLPDVQQDVEFDLRTSHGREVNVSVERWEEGGPVEVTIGEAPDPVEAAADECTAGASIAEVRDCHGLTARMDARADLVTVRVPRHCLGNARWVRAGVSSVRYLSASSIPHDVWVPPGGNPRASFGPLGPWVSLSP